VKRTLPTLSISGAVLGLSALLLTGCASSPAPGPGGAGSSGSPGIAAHGEGSVVGKPDRVTIVLGVQTESPSANGALTANAQKAAGVIAMLKNRGVADDDLQTSQLTVNPSYDQNGRINGYQVTNLVTATLHQLDKAGGVIDAAGQAAGDDIRVQQVSFSIDDDSKLMETARAEAVKHAKEQAKQMADAAGVRLGDLRSISQNSQGTPPPMPYYKMDLQGAGAATETPVQPGSQKLTVSVDMVYDINQ
jgi:hypothetical protein